MFAFFSGQDLFLILLIVLLLVGGKKIPELARGLGKGIHEFNKAKSGIDDEAEKKPAALPAEQPAKVEPAKPEQKPGEPGKSA
jgi:sec-independent protein translocase protein TatA